MKEKKEKKIQIPCRVYVSRELGYHCLNGNQYVTDKFCREKCSVYKELIKREVKQCQISEYS